MQASILIVSKNRKEDLTKTLLILDKIIDFSANEILVFLDGCTDGSNELKSQFTNMAWYESEKSLGASVARHKIYAQAKGTILIGFDDDAHPLQTNFIALIQSIFQENENLGIVSFQEIKGIFENDEKALQSSNFEKEEYYCSDFIGCGFAIRKEVYDATNGFPIWLDIYGEESCLSIEVIAKGYDILYSNRISVNHRVNKEERKKSGENYFRFGKQLKNTTFYYLVYFPFPLIRILRLYWHNFKKYALTDWECFKIFFKIFLKVIISLPKILKYRNPVDKKVLLKMRQFASLKF
jgi:GT2 family glycosyltransferase